MPDPTVVDEVVVTGERPGRDPGPTNPGTGPVEPPTLPVDHPERDPGAGGGPPTGFAVSPQMKAVQQTIGLMSTIAEALSTLPVLSAQDQNALEAYSELLDAIDLSIEYGGIVSQETVHAALTVAFDTLLGLGSDALGAAAVAMVGAVIGGVSDGPSPFGDAIGVIAGYAAGLVLSGLIPEELPGLLADAVLGGAEGFEYVTSILDRFNGSEDGRSFFSELLLWNIFGGDPEGSGAGFRRPDLFETQDEDLPIYEGQSIAYNLVTGTGASQTVFGTALDDIINPGRGADIIQGGAGNDTLHYRMPMVAMVVNLATGEAVQTQLRSEADTLVSIENVIGSLRDDTIIGNAVDNMLIGRRGADRLEGGGGDDELHGGEGNDYLHGGTGNDTAVYQDEIGDLYVNLNTGVATVGDDTDVLVSIENIIGGAFNDHIIGNNVANVLAGNMGNDIIYGGGGNDTIYGGDGDDFLYGEAGNDRFSVDRGHDVIDGGSGFDTAHFRGNRADYTIEQIVGGWLVSWGDDEQTTLYSIEQTVFADGAMLTTSEEWF